MTAPPGVPPPPPSRRSGAARDTPGAVASKPSTTTTRSGSSSSARACLEHLCRALSQLGVGTSSASSGEKTNNHNNDAVAVTVASLTAETLRRAKFNHESASAPLWRALHDLLIVGLAGYPDPATAATVIARVRGGGVGGGASPRSGQGRDSAGASSATTEAEDEACARLARHYLACQARYG